MDCSKTELTEETLAPNESTGGLLLTASRCFLSALFALALWFVVLLTNLGSCTFVTFAFAGAFLTHLSLRSNKRWELPAAVLAGAVYGLLYVRQGGPMATIPGYSFGIVGAFLGIGCLAVKSIRGIWESDPVAIQSNRANLIEVGSIPLLCILSGVAVSVAAGLLHTTYDPFLYAFDSSLGFHPGYEMGKVFQEHFWIAYPSALAYNYLPIGLVALRILQLRDGGCGVDLRLIYAALGAIGFCLYTICPGAGPLHVFSGFPYQPPASMVLQPIPVDSLLPRNAMPSLHVGWALLVLVNSWSPSRSRWVALCAAVFLVLTALATLGSGEHYLIDLIAVVPLTLAIQAGFKTRGPLRASAVLIGSVLTLAWLFALRTGALAGISAALSRALILATLIISFALYVKVVRSDIDRSV